MDRPKIGKTYFFVRSKEQLLEHTEFVRYADGSAGFVAEGFIHTHEGGPDAWRDALASLDRLGFQEMNEAKANGTLPAKWLPPSEQDS